MEACWLSGWRVAKNATQFNLVVMRRWGDALFGFLRGVGGEGAELGECCPLFQPDPRHHFTFRDSSSH